MMSPTPAASADLDPAPVAALAIDAKAPARRRRTCPAWTYPAWMCPAWMCRAIIAAGLCILLSPHARADAPASAGPLQMTAAESTQLQGTLAPQTSMAVPASPGKPSAPNQIQALQVQTRQSPDFIAFWKHFKQAAATDNRAALQAMTHLPFDLEDGNSYGASQFDKIHAQIYDERARTCLSSRLPVPDDEDYDVFCGDTIYIFGTEPDLMPDQADAADGSGWRLLETTSND